MVIDILRIMTYQTSCYFNKMRVRFSVTIMPACWHMSALTGFKNDMLRTNRVKDIAKMMLRRASRTRPSLGTSMKASYFDLKYRTIVRVYNSTTPKAIS